MDRQQEHEREQQIVGDVAYVQRLQKRLQQQYLNEEPIPDTDRPLGLHQLYRLLRAVAVEGYGEE